MGKIKIHAFLRILSGRDIFRVFLHIISFSFKIIGYQDIIDGPMLTMAIFMPGDRYATINFLALSLYSISIFSFTHYMHLHICTCVNMVLHACGSGARG